MSIKPVFGWLAIAVVVLATGYLNTHTDEVLVVIPWVFVAATCLAFAWPRRTWAWALLVGLAVPLSQVAAYAIGARLPYPNTLDGAATSAVVMVPALVGSLLGAGTRRATGTG